MKQTETDFESSVFGDAKIYSSDIVLNKGASSTEIFKLKKLLAEKDITEKDLHLLFKTLRPKYRGV